MSATPLAVGITIRATGGAQTASDLTQVQTAITGAGTAAQNSNRQFAEMAVAMRSAETAAQAINARIASATAIYENQVARLTMTTSAYRAYQLQLDGLHPSQIRHIQDLEATRSAASSTSSTISGLGSVMSAFGLTLGAVGLAALGKDILDTNRSMEALRAQLKALTGSTSEAQTTFDFITKFAVNTPFEINGLTKAFITLQNFGITPTTQVMEAITNQASKLGGSTTNLEGITLALGQAWGKGKLQGQEIMQLINQGVPVYDLLAKVTGKNTTQLADMSEKGLLTRDVIDKLIKKMGEMASGSNVAAMDTLNGKISNLSDAWHQWEDALLGDKSEGIIKSIVTSVTDLLNILTKQMGTTIDAQIAHAQSRIKTFNSMGAVGSFVSDMAGYDINVEKNKLDSLLKQKALQDETAAIKAHSAEVLKDAAIAESAQATQDKTNTKKQSGSKANSTAMSEEEKAAKSLQTAYDNQIGSLLKSIALEGKNSLTDTAEYEVQNGALKNLTESKKLYLLQQTAALQNKQAETKVNDATRTELAALKDQYDKLTLSAQAYYAKKLGTQGLTPQQAAPLIKQNDINIQLKDEAKKSADAKAALDAYNQSLDQAQTKMVDLGAISSSVFSAQLGGINLLTAAFGTMVTALANNTKELEKNKAAQKLNDAQANSQEKTANIVKYAAVEKKLNEDNIKLQLTGAGQIAGAAAKMFDQKSAAAKAFHAIEIAMSVARLAMDAEEIASSIMKTGKSIAAAAAKFFEESGWLGFAGVAAMMAVMVGLGFSGSSDSGGGVTPPPGNTGTGTVLGDKSAVSDSVNSTNELLKSIHASEYTELRGINSGVKDLSKSILDTITNLFQGGGLSNVTLSPTTMTGLSSFFSSIPLAGSIANFFFGGKQTQTLIAQGIAINPTPLSNVMSGGNVSSYQYADINTHTSGGLFTSSSDKLSQIHLGLDQKVQDSINLVFKSMGDTMMSVAKQLGGDMPNKLKQYIIPFIDIALLGLSGTDAAKKFNGVISATLDDMASAVFGDIVAKYQQLGEGMLQTAIRIVSEVAVVKDALSKSLLTLGDNAIATSDAIIQAAGGIAEFQRQFNDYFDKFYTEAEKTQKLGEMLAGQLGDLGLSLATSRAAYRAQIEALDMTNTLDQQRYSLLISLAGAADTYYSSLEKVGQAQSSAAVKALNDFYASEIKSSVDAVTKAKADLSAAYKAEQSTLTATINKLTQFITSLENLKDSLALGNLSPGTPLDKYSTARDQMMAAYNTIQGGPGSTTASQAAYDNAMSTISAKFQAFLDASRVYNASGSQYTADYNLVMQQITQLSAVANTQLTDAQKQFNALTEANNNLGIINNSVLSVKDAIDALAVALKAKDAAVALAGGSASTDAQFITGLYNTILHRAPDQSGLDFWLKDLANGATRATVLNQFQNSPEAILGGSPLNQLLSSNLPQNQTVATTDLQFLNDAYNSILHRAPDPGGLAFWLQVLATGSTRDSVLQAIAGSPEALGINGSHKDGLDFVPFDGYLAELHKGERVLTAGQVQNEGVISQEIVAELKALRAELATLRAEQNNQAGAIIQSNYDANARAADKVVAGNEKVAKKTDWVNKSRAVIQ